MASMTGNTKSYYRKSGKPKNTWLKRNRFTAMAFIIALGAIGLVFSGVSDSPSGMVVGNISEIQVSEDVEPYVSPEQIADYYSRAIEMNPNDQISRYNYAIVLERLNQTDNALEQYALAIEISANYTAPLNNIAILLQKLGRLNESKDYLEKALLIEENNSAIILNYANILAELGQNSMAEENYRKAIELNLDDKGAYRNFAQFLYNNDRCIEAKEMLEKSY